MSWLLTPGLGGVEMPSGTVLGVDRLISLLFPQLAEGEGGIRYLRETLVEMGARIQRTGRVFDSLMNDVRILHGELMRRGGLPFLMNPVGEERDMRDMSPLQLARQSLIEPRDDWPEL